MISECYRKSRFYIFLLINFTTRPQENLGGGVWNILNLTTRPRENLVVELGNGIFLISSQDHEIHHKSFQSKKNYIGK